jgi:hypothetical protein
MDQQSQPHPGRGVEFLDDSGDFSEPTGYGAHGRQWWQRATVCRPSWVSFAVSGAMCAAAVITIVSVLLPQLIFHRRVLGEPARVTYALDGLGRYHLVGRGSGRFAVGSDAPALGEVAIAGAVLLMVAAVVALLPTRRTLVSALHAGVACFAAGVIVAVLACEVLIEGTGFPNQSWAAGFWLLVVGASLAGLAALVNAAYVGLDARSGRRTTTDCAA